MNLSLQTHAIDINALRSELEDHSCGAMVWFEGRVRNHNEGQAVECLEYEAYEPMCISLGKSIIDEAGQQWSFQQAVCVHRSGLLQLGELAVVVAVVSHHRDEAFRAARYIIDEVKHRLPIWKREHYSNGDRHWVNCQRCGQAASSTPPAGAPEQSN